MGCQSQWLRAAASGCTSLLMTILVSAATIAAVLIIGLLPRRAVSLLLYARQTGQPCATCHTAFLELTPFGRRFKLGGYMLDGGDCKGPPFGVMLQPTFTNTQAAQPASQPRIWRTRLWPRRLWRRYDARRASAAAGVRAM